MPTTKLFIADEIDIICREYLEGKTLQEIAMIHYCSWPTIRNYLKRCGIPLRSYTLHRMVHKHPVAMIEHDWNSGMTADKIIGTYKFKTKKQLYNFMRRMRAQGYNFRKRVTQ